MRAGVHGVELERSLGPEFFRSVEYRKMVELSTGAHSELAPGSEVRRGERTAAVASLAQAMEWLPK